MLYSFASQISMIQFSKSLILGFLLFTSFEAFSQRTGQDSTIGCTFLDDVHASFPGGIETWNKYLLRKLNPAIAKQNGAPVGIYTVYVHFKITKVGSIDSVRATTNHGYGMEEEAVRVIQHAPKWSPAIKNAINVPEWKQHAITFTVSK